MSGNNCWRKVCASRVAFLVDGESYFGAVASAFERARRSIWIVGWDTNSRIRLRRHEGAPGLESFLESRLVENPELTIHVVSWDFAMVYALERELTPLFRLSWSRHSRLRYHLDAHHPLGASHHQKMVVVDDRVAFVGGLDLTKNRWDSSEHLEDDPRRRTPYGRISPPFHDVQMAVSGDAARALGDLARERWYRSTKERVEPESPPTEEPDPWPPDLEADAENAVVGIARTFPEYDSVQGVREVERLYLDAIAAARESIYIETQYLTSSSITEALSARLEESDGPEILVVVPERCTGWLEETTMGILRNRRLRSLVDSDRHGKFRVYRPVRGEESIFVHSKVMVVDDRLARVGSSNLTSRSMGLDSECDLALEAEDEATSRAVASLRSRLLAEHLGVSREELEQAHARSGSLLQAVDSLRSGARTLVPVSPEPEDEWTVATVGVVDPERPIEPDLLVEEFVSEDAEPARRVAWWRMSLLSVAALVLAALWQWGPLGDWVTLPRLSAWADALRDSPWSFPVVIAVYVVSGLLMVPLTLLILVTAATFGMGLAMLYSILGTLASGMVTFGVGHWIGRDLVRQLAGTKLNRVAKKLARRGVLAIATVRLLPLAPYGIVNMVAGASHIRFRDFTLGTLLGTLPGITAVTLLENQVERVIQDPDLGNVLVAAALLGAAIAFGVWVRRRVGSGGAR